MSKCQVPDQVSIYREKGSMKERLAGELEHLGYRLDTVTHGWERMPTNHNGKDEALNQFLYVRYFERAMRHRRH